jgi:hypothetical protein
MWSKLGIGLVLLTVVVISGVKIPLVEESGKTVLGAGEQLDKIRETNNRKAVLTFLDFIKNIIWSISF